MPKVSLHSTTDPRDITKLLHDIHTKNCFDMDETILIKPNCVTDDLPLTGVTVDPVIVACIVAYLREHGFNNIIVGEGGMTLYDMPSVFEKVGLTDALRPYGITDVVAVDNVGAYLMGCEPTDVEYFVRAKDKPFILTT